MSKLDLAIHVATLAHWSVLDKNGESYIRHPLRVMEMAARLGLDEEVQQIAVLHDVVEDTDYTLNDLALMFPPRVIAGVDSMTRRNGNKNCEKGMPDETYFAFCLRAALNPDARRVKLLDNADNMRPERRFEGMKLDKRYKKAAEFLWKAEAADPNWDFIKRFEGVVTWV